MKGVYVVQHAGGQSPYWYAVYRDATGRRVKKSTHLISKSRALTMARALHRAAREMRKLRDRYYRDESTKRRYWGSLLWREMQRMKQRESSGGQ